MKKIAAGLIALPALLPTSVSAATITPVLGCEGGRDKSCYSIWIIGVIQSDDHMKFNQVIESNKITKAVVVLNSPGGNVTAGLAIGRTIKEKGFTTGLENKGLCTSVCGAIWLAGSKRFVMAGSRIGFHAAYYKDQQGRMVETGMGNALVGAYYAHLGLSDEAIVHLTKSGPDAMTWLKADDAKKLGITAEIIDPNKKPIWDKFKDGMPAEPPSTPQLDLNNIEDAKRVQQRLIDLGFLFGSADGIWGPLSRGALEDFRATQEIGPGDTWDETTQQLLFGDSAVRAPSTAPQSFVGLGS
jgi:ATP-dependent protease ClpP protease subunit